MRAKLISYRSYTKKTTGELMYRVQLLVKDDKWEGGETVRECSVSSSFFPAPERGKVYEVNMHLAMWNGRVWWNLDAISLTQ